MKRCLPYFFLALVFCLLAGCGKKGPVQPPVMRIPQSVSDFSLIQRGDRFILSWTNPTAYVDGQALAGVAEVEIWLLVKEFRESEPSAVTLRQFEKEATLVKRLPKEKFPSFQEENRERVRLNFPFEPEKGKEEGKMFIFGLRVKDERRRISAFSKLLSLKKRTPPSPPQKVRATVFEDHIHLSWEAPFPDSGLSAPLSGAGYHVYRAEEQSFPQRITSVPVRQNEYRDTNFSFDRTYRYFVRATASSQEPLLESEDSETIDVRPLDTFPPSPPLGLSAVAGTDYVALSWLANSESDLGVYRIWRREAGQEEFEMVATVSAEENTYLDSVVEKRKRYDYAITALDKVGNESRKSEIASVVTRQELR